MLSLSNWTIKTRRNTRGPDTSRLPALVDGDVTLFESGAVLLYLGEKYGGLDTIEKRANAAKWVLFANSTLIDAAFAAHMRDKWMPEVLGAVEKMVTEHDYIQGDEFSVADAAVGSTLLKARPAFGAPKGSTA